MSKTYTCEMCRGIFTSSVPDDQLLNEYAEEFGPVIASAPEHMALICHTCYEKIQSTLSPEEKERLNEYIKQHIVKKNSN